MSPCEKERFINVRYHHYYHYGLDGVGCSMCDIEYSLDDNVA